MHNWDAIPKEDVRMKYYHLGSVLVLICKAQPRLTCTSLKTVLTVLTRLSALEPLVISTFQKSLVSPLPFWNNEQENFHSLLFVGHVSVDEIISEVRHAVNCF